MRKIILGGFIFITLAGVLFINSRNNSSENGNTDTGIYSVAVLSPDVLLKASRNDSFAPITDSVDIRVGAEIKTSAKGRAKILYPNGTITTIEGDSHIIISNLTGEGDASRLELVFGSIWSKIQNILGTNEYYEVETGNIVASVRGTIFALEYRNLTSKVFGIGNKVDVSVKDASGSLIPSSQTEVASGQKVIISGTAGSTTPLPTTPISDAEINSGFIERNLIEITDEEANNSWHKGVKDILKRLKKGLSSPSPSATPTPTPSPSPSAAASLAPVIQLVTPSSIKVGVNFDIVGKNFLSVTGAPQVASVFIGTTEVQFVIQSTTMIMVIPGTKPAGIYDIEIVSTAGVKSALPRALTIR